MHHILWHTGCDEPILISIYVLNKQLRRLENKRCPSFHGAVIRVKIRGTTIKSSRGNKSIQG